MAQYVGEDQTKQMKNNANATRYEPKAYRQCMSKLLENQGNQE